ncbi:tyrosine-type recombinase/integrase [Oceanibaculum indicum]|uniref:Site-specific recombinase XerD n=1 Tax=Oceanibaculum indicum TaxID=526216 RepID=A0A420WNQ5_9PROT|nr:site-specific integrase [Oceanibaculum indicum]RKQ72495.1 site-specific recombinase XerD [Oceanibaculum indicum]
MKLTLRAVAALEARDREFIAWDDELPGFGVRVKPNGLKSYVLQYRNQESRSRRKTISRHGVLTVEEARKQARQLKAAVDRGHDPVAETKERRNAPEMAALCERYFEEHALVFKKPSSIKQDRRMIDRRIIPMMGRVKVDSVTRADIQKIHYALRDGPYEANRVVSLLSKMFNLAEQWGWRPPRSNPVLHIKRYKEKKHERFLSPDQLRALRTLLEEVRRTGEVHPSVSTALTLLFRTGMRLSEVTNLRWEYVDWEVKVLRLPDSKTGAKVLPIADAVVDMLAALPRMSDFVCPSPHNDEKPISGVTVDHNWRRLRARIGLEEYRLHDLRHNFGSWGGNSGQSLPMIGALLGHKDIQTTQRYAHLSTAPLRKAANEINALLDQVTV